MPRVQCHCEISTVLDFPSSPISSSFSLQKGIFSEFQFPDSSLHLVAILDLIVMAAAASKFFVRNHHHQLLILFLCAMIPLLSAAADHEFVYNGFNSSDLIRDGAVITAAGALQLTNESRHVIGRAFHRTPIPVLNASSWSTYFVFQISPAAAEGRGGYGFAFTLSPSPSFPDGADGHYLGVLNPSNDGRASNHIFMVEFDTVKGLGDSEDTTGNNVGVNVNSMNSSRSVAASHYVGKDSEHIPLESARPIQTWIEYDREIGVVNVYIAPLKDNKPIQPLLYVNYNLSDVFKDTMYAGFSAATGEKASSHYILGWSFRLNGAVTQLDPLQLPVVPMEAEGPSQLPVVPMEAEGTSDSRRIRSALTITFSILLFAFAVAAVSVLCYRRGTRLKTLEDWELDCPHRFRYKDLYRATKGFRETEKIGVGGFGEVYLGVLPSTTSVPEVAVKKILSNNPMQGMREFAAEIECLGRLRHKNLVNLQGWCKHKNDLLLVYDYVSNGSLHSLLYTPKSASMALTWDQRFNILKGVGSGLLYLHEEWEKVVIHRDVKSSNVLIDCDMNPRLGDFGLARLYDHRKLSHTTNVVGTIGYIAPELTQTGKASTSTDVFAYGILLLEVCCGRAPVVYEMDWNVILVDWVKECLQTGNLFGAVDAKLNSVYSREEMELVLGLGLLCSHSKPEARPSMKKVMKYLNGDEVLPLLDGLVDDGPKRVHEITSRFLALTTPSITSSSCQSHYSSGGGVISSSSFNCGR